jgi:hypothetical protein
VIRLSFEPQGALTLKHHCALFFLIKQDADKLSEESKKALKRHVEKVIKEAKTSFAERALLHDRARFLFKMNNEAKVRRSTKSVILGKAKVMSWADLEQARASSSESCCKRTSQSEGKRQTRSEGPECYLRRIRGYRGQ